MYHCRFLRNFSVVMSSSKIGNSKKMVFPLLNPLAKIHIRQQLAHKTLAHTCEGWISWENRFIISLMTPCDDVIPPKCGFCLKYGYIGTPFLLNFAC